VVTATLSAQGVICARGEVVAVRVPETLEREARSRVAGD